MAEKDFCIAEFESRECQLLNDQHSKHSLYVYL